MPSKPHRFGLSKIGVAFGRRGITRSQIASPSSRDVLPDRTVTGLRSCFRRATWRFRKAAPSTLSLPITLGPASYAGSLAAETVSAEEAAGAGAVVPGAGSDGAALLQATRARAGSTNLRTGPA